MIQSRRFFGTTHALANFRDLTSNCHITVSTTIVNETHGSRSIRRTTHDTAHCASRRQLSASAQSAIRLHSAQRAARSGGGGGGLEGPSDALSYWSTARDFVVPPPFGCTGAARPRNHEISGSLTNGRKRGLQVQRDRPRCATRVFQTKQSVFRCI